RQVIFAIGERIAGGEEMAGVDADCDAVAGLRLVDHPLELLKTMPKAGPLPRRRFKYQFRFTLRRRAMQDVDRLRHQRDPLLFALLSMRAGMNNDADQTELLRPIEF